MGSEEGSRLAWGSCPLFPLWLFQHLDLFQHKFPQIFALIMVPFLLTLPPAYDTNPSETAHMFSKQTSHIKNKILMISKHIYLTKWHYIHMVVPQWYGVNIIHFFLKYFYQLLFTTSKHQIYTSSFQHYNWT